MQEMSDSILYYDVRKNGYIPTMKNEEYGVEQAQSGNWIFLYQCCQMVDVNGYTLDAHGRKSVLTI